MRSGKTLIEMAVVVSVAALVLAGAARTLAVMLRADATGTQKVAETVGLSQLARQFRLDVHQARSVTLVEGDDMVAPALELSLPDDRTVVWNLWPEETVRRTTGRAGAEEQQLFRLAGVTVQIVEQRGIEQAVLIVPLAAPTSGRDVEGRATRFARIAATPGRDRRFGEVVP